MGVYCIRLPFVPGKCVSVHTNPHNWRPDFLKRGQYRLRASPWAGFFMGHCQVSLLLGHYFSDDDFEGYFAFQLIPIPNHRNNPVLALH